MKKLLIIDSNSIINRAFYGVRYLSAKDGTPTNAIYGFLNILLKLIDEQKPDYICAAFDLKAPTFRHKMYDQYKAQRKPMPQELVRQMPIAKEVLSAMNIEILEFEGYEADDIIGTVSKICEKENVECMIATGDKDDLQLASDKTKVILTVTKSGVNETTIYDEQAVIDRYNVTPLEFIDVKALMGDASDNIPGVAGIGEKTAMSLIEKHKSIEYIYENIDDIGLKGAMLEKLKKGRDMAFLSKTLATIDTKVPIDFDFEKCSTGKKSVSENASPELADILKRLELNSIIKRLELKPTPVVNENKDFFEKINLSTIDDEKELDKFLSRVENKGEFASLFEFENDNLKCIAIAIENESVKVIINQKTVGIIKELLKNPDIKKVTFGIKNDLVKLKDEYIIEGISHDIEIAAYLIDPAKSNYSIEALAEEYLSVICQKDENTQMSLFDEVEENDDFLQRKAACMLPLINTLYKKIAANSQQKLYEEIELPLSRVLADMQIAGIKIDQEQLSDFSDLLDNRINEISNEIFNLAGEEFNLNSPKQLGTILFEKLGLKSIKKTKSGYSTNADVLEKLMDKHPIIPMIMEYRQISKLKSTYCDGLFAVIDKADGRIHSNFTQTVTVTGRISSTEPNMQNIPVRTALGRELRKMFISEEGKVLIDADYSQIELRVLAHISNDKKMLDAFKNDEDIHTVTASQVLGIPPEDVTPEQRSSAKAVNFGIVYGIGEYSLSQDIHVSVKAAKSYIENYLLKYNGVGEYMKNIKEQAKADGYVKTLMNRIRYIPELKSPNFNIRAFGERVALNTPIQGTAADIIKLAMVRVHERLKKEKLKTKLILQVHDELILESPEDEKELALKILQSEMENAIELSIPLKVDCGVGKSWYDAK